MLDRLSVFYVKLFKLLRHSSPIKTLLIAFVLCFLIDLPEMFSYSFDMTDDGGHQHNSSSSSTYNFCLKNNFFQSKYGNFLLTSTYFFRDGFLILTDIFLSLILVIYYIKYVKLRNMNRNRFNLNYNSHRILFSSKKNLIPMTIMLSIVSIIAYFFASIVRYFMFHYQLMFDSFYKTMFYFSFNVAMEEFMNFFVFIIFNKRFRHVFLEMIRWKNYKLIIIR